MLRVTTRRAEWGDIWELEGRLAGEWVNELERCWKERPAQAGASLEVHLKAVSFIDVAGKQLLSEMHARGVGIRGCGCMTKAVVEEITRRGGAN
jgi:ABC-type transporter Mla MlaB component